MVTRNYRGSYEAGGDIKMRANKPDEYAGYAEEKRRAQMQRVTVHKAVAAFLSSLVTMLVALGVVMPTWVTETGIDTASMVLAGLISVVGSLIPTFAVWKTDNKPRGPGEGPLGG